MQHKKSSCNGWHRMQEQLTKYNTVIVTHYEEDVKWNGIK